jgi:hypothetical protein
MGQNKTWCLRGINFGPLFLLYVNDLPKAIKHKATPILSDDTTVLIMSPNTTHLKNNLNIAFEQLSKWFKANLRSRNFDKTYFIQFTNKSTYTSDICIKYGDKQMSNTSNTNIPGLFINDTSSWKTHTEYIMSKLHSACYAMGSIKPFVSQNILKIIYYSYFHSVMTYGLMFYGHSPDSVKIFRLQKKINRIMHGCRSKDSCRKLFMKLQILPFPSRHILSLLPFVIKNKKQCTANSEVYHIDMRQHLNLHQPLINLNKYQKGVYYLGIKAFNVLPSYINQESNSPKRFKFILKKFLYENSFCSLQEYCQVCNIPHLNLLLITYKSNTQYFKLYLIFCHHIVFYFLFYIKVIT